jgi:hypothetical protein
MENKIKISVRWWGGYLEEFECIDVRFGSDLLWLKLSEDQSRHISIRKVMWYSLNRESHEK